MKVDDENRRLFLKRARTSLIGAGAVVGFGNFGNRTNAVQTCAAETRGSQNAMTPADAQQRLKEGNARFVSGKMLGCDYMQQVKATGAGLFPFAMIVGCIDSRAASELIFDQGVGDIRCPHRQSNLYIGNVNSAYQNLLMPTNA